VGASCWTPFLNWVRMSSVFAKTHSVIVPCRGHYAYFKDCLASLCKQWVSLDEIVVVIDNDIEALQKAKEFIDAAPRSHTKWRLAYLKEHGGVYKALNVGLSLATSDVISFCGADDMWAPQRSENIMVCFDSEKSVVNTFHRTIDSEGRHLAYGEETLGGVFSYHRSMIAKLGMFREWECSADSDFYYRAMAAGGHRCIHRSYSYVQRRHSDQLTSRDETKFGSEKRLKYEAMWNDGTVHHSTDLASFDLVLERG